MKNLLEGTKQLFKKVNKRMPTNNAFNKQFSNEEEKMEKFRNICQKVETINLHLEELEHELKRMGF